MTTHISVSSAAGWLALATGIAGISASILIILFYAVGGSFGTLNDIFNGVVGMLSVILAWMLFSKFRLNFTFIHRFTLILAVIGAIIVGIGSILILFDFTGWVLAGWYTTAGFALIGIWLLDFSNSTQQNNMLSRNLSTFGLIVGSIMAIGIFVIPGIMMGIDAIESTPWYVSLGLLGFIGTYFLYPIWTLWLGRTLLSR
jgi:hypothetical protein